ncbi:MAG: Glycolate dehydrogenase, FAD-binding subunit GlcE [uncultured Chloroflexia bacterium]|uniref:Glycolate dehydrogenase, FAD-binding subunit GlcE n=1 Tax=uncultured Chloroflexia bacterium TaxID=1672391 RepID=A0A6J4HHN6_9CHLR|nr:MAG: Glycolate dehydrogenase, FAD-binding subunit GlcE [uncultured Chloroflexia bacterium]
MSQGQAALQLELAGVVGIDHLYAGGIQDAVDGIRPQWVVEPRSADEVAGVLRHAGSAGRSVVPRGGGTKLGWGNRPRSADLVLSTRRLDRVLEHAWGDMTATIEAGCTVAQVQEMLARHGQRLALDPLWPEHATIGGVLATNDSGSLRIRFGAMRDLIIGITIVLADGTVARSGGKVVKNVAGYDLPKLLTASLGTLGVITEASFRLHPLPRESRTLTFAMPAAAAANDLLRAISDSHLAPSGVQIRMASDLPPHVDVRFEGIVASVLDEHSRQVRRFAGSAEEVTALADIWRAPEALWYATESSLVCKLSVLPAELTAFCEAVQHVAGALHLSWSIVAQSVGVGWLRLQSSNEQALLAAFGVLRARVAERHGSLVLAQASPEVKGRVDVWGVGGDALSLMQRVKARFDPRGILNPGRYVGGI